MNNNLKSPNVTARVALILLITLTLFSCQFDPQENSHSIASKIDALMNQRIDSLGPGAVVFVKKNSEIIYHKAFGKADLETGEQMTIDHVFDMASITKEFTAASILQLEERGLISLTDDLRKYVPDFPTEDKLVTIEHLLTHTSGIKTFTTLEWAQKDLLLDFDSSIDVINYFKKDSLDFDPGEQFSYCNMGFFLLGHIIEQISGQTYADYINEHLLNPSNMVATSYPRQESEVKNLSTGYEFINGKIIKAREKSLTQNCGQSGLHSTAHDLSKWYDAIIEHRILSVDKLQQAWTSYHLNDGRPTGYGLGWNIENKLGSTTVSHTGFMFGHSSTDLFFPDDSLLVIVLSNVGAIDTVNTNEIAFDISSYFFKNRIIKMSGQELDKFIGTYLMDPGFKAKVYREGTQLYVEVDGGRPDKVVAISKSKFKVKDFDASMEFIADESGEYNKIILSRSEMRFEGIKENL